MDIEGLQQQAVRTFIRAHLQDDPAELMLQRAKYPDLPLADIVAQLHARRKARRKLPAWAEDLRLIFPPALAVQQASSEATARYKASVVGGSRGADLTAGFGADAYFMARQFNTYDLVEQQADLVAVAKHNFKELNRTNVNFNTTTTEAFLTQTTNTYDWLYVDPARRANSGRKVFRPEDTQPDVIQLLPLLYQKADRILIKTSPLLDIKQATRQLQGLRAVHAVESGGECKEVLYELERGFKGEITYKAANADKEPTTTLSFSAEHATHAPLTDPETYIYEPGPALMKLGLFNRIAEHFACAKLHPNSHLYTTDRLIPRFPGRTFRLEAVLPPDAKAIRRHLPDAKANLTVRNFPQSVAHLRKKWRLKDGGSRYLFATTLHNDKHILLLCRKVNA